MPHLTRLTALLLLSLLTGCGQTFEPRRTATLKTGPDAPGYLIVGLADENARREFGTATEAISVLFESDAGKTIVASRYGCGSTKGFYSTRPCDLTKVGWVLLEIPAGVFKPAIVVEQLHQFVTQKSLKDEIRTAPAVPVGPGEVVYAGDYVFASDFKAQTLSLLRRDRDPVAASQLLLEYPGLRPPTVIDRSADPAPR